jgi:hypothetical protein
MRKQGRLAGDFREAQNHGLEQKTLLENEQDL